MGKDKRESLRPVAPTRTCIFRGLAQSKTLQWPWAFLQTFCSFLSKRNSGAQGPIRAELGVSISVWFEFFQCLPVLNFLCFLHLMLLRQLPPALPFQGTISQQLGLQPAGPSFTRDVIPGTAQICSWVGTEGEPPGYH